MQYYKKEVTNLKNNVLENVVLTRNGLTGEVTTQDNGVMLLTIPYSIGFRAFVDGEETTLMEGNIMYTALNLKAGTHTIELKYETPYLKIGGVISAISLVIFIGIVVYDKNKQRDLE